MQRSLAKLVGLVLGGMLVSLVYSMGSNIVEMFPGGPHLNPWSFEGPGVASMVFRHALSGE